MENLSRKATSKYLGISLRGVNTAIDRGTLKLDEKKKKVLGTSILQLEKELEERRKIKPPVWIQRVSD